MNREQIAEAVERVWRSWRDGSRIEALPESCRPRTVQDAYAVQAALEGASGDRLAGWKIAATSSVGQAHIAVDGPLAGRLFGRRVLRHPARLVFGANNMRVAEAEFAFVLKRDVPPNWPSELINCIDTLHPAIEIPDSRYEDFTRAGAPQLIADNACAHWLVLGDAADDAWQGVDLAEHEVELHINGEIVTRGRGSDVLGDPRSALAWIANNHADRGQGLRAGEIVTTGVCGKPSRIAPGDRVVADFGLFGRAEVTFDRAGLDQDGGKQ